jgi:hypothetical protein
MPHLSNPPPSPPQDDSPSQKKVTFSPKARIRYIRDAEQSSGSTTWYQQRHYKAFKTDCIKTAAIARNFENLRSATRKHISTRGLEHYVDTERAALRRERRLEAWDVVLYEQMNQYESGAPYQPQHIAEAYREVSIGCQLEAHLKALQYQKESEAEYREESRRSKAQKACEQSKRNPVATALKNVFLASAA